MDRKTKHRILGILVVIGLVIILLPFFQSGKEIRNDTALVAAPPFPDQPIQVTTTTVEQKPAIPMQAANIPQKIVNPTPSADDTISGIKDQPDDTISVIHPSVINHAPTANNAMANSSVSPAINTKAKPAVQAADNANNKPREAKLSSPGIAESTATPATTLALPTNIEIMKPDGSNATTKIISTAMTTKTKPVKTEIHKIIENKKSTQTVKSVSNVSTHTYSSKSRLAYAQKPIDEDGLAKLKSAAWVIQIGSYKNKTNALRIVNQLRANGYRAFIQQISTALGEHTRIFVGPENKQSTARALAERLQSEMHIQGIVISYKPLTL